MKYHVMCTVCLPGIQEFKVVLTVEAMNAVDAEVVACALLGETFRGFVDTKAAT